MKKSACVLVTLLACATGAHAQSASDDGVCPQLPADSGLAWTHKGTANSDFCRALRADGSEAFGLYIAKDAPFKPNRSDRAEQASIDGHDVVWYRSELATRPGVVARETVIDLPNGRVAHMWIQSESDEQLQQALGQTRNLRFRTAQLSSK